MTKEKAKEIAEKYQMEIMRNPVTSEAWGLWVDSDSLIAELDALTECNEKNWACTRETMADEYRYKLILPANWFDLWGWR